LLVLLVGCNFNTSEIIYLSCDGNVTSNKLISEFPTVFKTESFQKKFTIVVNVMRREDLFKKYKMVDPVVTNESKNSKEYVVKMSGEPEIYTNYSDFMTDGGLEISNHDVFGDIQKLKVKKSETSFSRNKNKFIKKMVIYDFELDRISGDFFEKEETYIDNFVIPSTVDVKGSCKKTDKIF